VRRGSFRELRIASIGPTLYQLFQRPIEILGAKVFAFDFVKFEGSTPRTTDELEDILSCKPNVVFVTNPNNPVGEYFPSVLLKRLVEMCQSQAVTIVIDEMQNFLPVAGKGLGYGSWINAPHVVRVDSFSKHFGLAEYRIGWVIGDKKLIGDRYTGIIGRVKGLMGNAPRAANDTILSLLATQKELLCSKTATLPAQWTCLLNKEKYIARQLSYMPRVTVVPREGCFNLTMRIHCGKSDLEFAHRLIKAGTLIMPCEGYGYRSEDVVMRITFAERWQKIHHGIKVLRSVLEDKGL
jgi:aspartate/methionine/tyrosine aminotransferase